MKELNFIFRSLLIITLLFLFFSCPKKPETLIDPGTSTSDYPDYGTNAIRITFKADGVEKDYTCINTGFILYDQFSVGVDVAGAGAGSTGGVGSYSSELYIYIPMPITENTYTITDKGAGLIYFDDAGRKYRYVYIANSPDPADGDYIGCSLSISLAGSDDTDIWGTFSGTLAALYQYGKTISITEGKFKGKKTSLY